MIAGNPQVAPAELLINGYTGFLQTGRPLGFALCNDQ